MSEIRGRRPVTGAFRTKVRVLNGAQSEDGTVERKA